ncbi:MAG: aminotransferase class III-fold pyridoxal phosphate-dependent enzyme [Gemmatimonadetes bacterium]|nr:aminotransferase class III-fold pyridoxal phosphate-dependent enzyme [Gemmatimonadota bacterium]
MIDTIHISPVVSRIVPDALLADRGEGAYLYTCDGRRFLDFTCGIGVTNTGHAHPRVVGAVQKQAGRLIHGQANIVFHEPLLRLTEELAGIVPPGLDTFFFANSGGRDRRGGGEAGEAREGAPERHRLQRVLPRTHASGHEPGDVENGVPGGLSAAGSRGLRCALPLRVPLRVGRGDDDGLLPEGARVPPQGAGDAGDGDQR